MLSGRDSYQFDSSATGLCGVMGTGAIERLREVK